MTVRVETKRERRLAFASGANAARGARRGAGRHRHDDGAATTGLTVTGDVVAHSASITAPVATFDFASGSKSSAVSSIFVFAVVRVGEALGDFGLLVMNRRTDRRQAGRMGARMLDDVLAECIMIVVARRFGRLGRLEAHVVPAEILEAVADLAEALRAHGRTSGALAGEQTGGKRGERFGFGGHRYAPLLADDAAAEAADGTRTGRQMPGAAPGAAKTVRRKFFSRRSEI